MNRLAGIIKSLVNIFGFDIHRYTFHHVDLLLIRKCMDITGVDLILDIGANQGQFAIALFSSGYKGKISSYEPLKDTFQALKKNARKYSKWSVYNFGVGSKEGTAELYVSSNTFSSSLLEVTDESISAAPESRISRKEVIQLTTLKKIIAENPLSGNKVYLKLDVQGFELEVLKGAEEIPGSIAVIQAELSTLPLYKGAPDYLEVIEFLRKAGFELYSLIPEFRNPSNGRLLQFDGIFIRSDIMKGL